MSKAIYTIEYYEEDSRFGWTNTMHDKVLANSKKHALEKFAKKHPNKKGSIVNWEFADY